MTAQAADKRDRDKYRTQGERNRDDRPRHFLHRTARGSDRIETKFNIPLDVFDHHDRIVHHDTNRENHAEQGQGVDRETGGQHHCKRADDGHWHGDQRDNRRAPGLEKNDYDHDHQRDGFKQGRDHGLDRFFDEARWVVDDLVIQAFRKIALGRVHHPAYGIRQRDGV